MENENEIELNIQPQAGVIGVFSRLNYKAWYAIGEFVDNSTQSFYSHQEELRLHGIEDVEININYDAELDILTITDTAFGMERDDFARAVKVDSPPENKNGRNEFGMGLKTAASWFGNIWSVQSTQYGSSNQYFTEINIPEMREKNLNTVTIHRTQVNPSTHGTTIIIREVTKKIGSGRTKGKIITLLTSMYRRDLDTGIVHINYDGDPLSYQEYSCLKFRDKVWRKPVDLSFEFEGKPHHVVGFVGILAKGGGFDRAGFALFRRNRVVVGGDEYNYKPTEIFGQIQSQVSLRLFGELDLEDFPINQAKDGFVWDDGLEEAFLHALKPQIKDYIEIAKISNKDREEEESRSKNVSDQVQNQTQNAINHAFFAANKPSEPVEPQLENLFSQSEQQEVDLFKEYQEEQNNLPEEVDEQIRHYTIALDSVTKYNINVQWTVGNSQKWIAVNPTDDNTIDIQLNINHPFFKPFSEKADFKLVLEKFAIAFALAEHRAMENRNEDDSISPYAFSTNINKFLRELAE